MGKKMIETIHTHSGKPLRLVTLSHFEQVM
jgi:hypothetical protein